MPKRLLPSRRNPLLSPEQTPQWDELVAKRHLGQTDLRVKIGQVGTSNATKPTNLGLFDYVHLRAPLPQNLNGSEILIPSRPGDAYPRHYFLMRRSSDGFVSASGLFKAAFPWATKAQELHERNHIRSLPTTDSEEVAGNFWVAPESALEVASDYGISIWVEALLDPTPIAHPSNKKISTPPTFHMAKSAATDASTKSARKSTATPQPSSSSPSKMAAPARPKATPRRRGPKKKDGDSKAADANSSVADSEEVEDAAEAVANAVSQSLADSTVGKAAEPLAKNTARVTVNSDVQDDGTIETTRTSVKVEMPADAPSQPLPESPEEALETAKKIVADAVTMQDKSDGTSPVAKSNRKRKAVEALDLIEPEEEIVEVVSGAEPAKGKKADKPQFGERKGAPPAKRTRIMVPATDFRREKMQKRALMGLSASLAVGAIIPFVSSFF